jgi:hypothetical protein
MREVNAKGGVQDLEADDPDSGATAGQFVVALFGCEAADQRVVRESVERLTARVRESREVVTATPPDRMPGWEVRLIGVDLAVIAFGIPDRWRRVLELAAGRGGPVCVVPMPPLSYPNPTGVGPGPPRAGFVCRGGIRRSGPGRRAGTSRPSGRSW